MPEPSGALVEPGAIPDNAGRLQRQVLCFLLLLGLVAALGILWERVGREHANGRVETVLTCAVMALARSRGPRR